MNFTSKFLGIPGIHIPTNRSFLLGPSKAHNSLQSYSFVELITGGTMTALCIFVVCYITILYIKRLQSARRNEDQNHERIYDEEVDKSTSRIESYEHESKKLLASSEKFVTENLSEDFKFI
jgi:hypothetical protein